MLGTGVTTGDTVNRPLQQSSPPLRHWWHQLPIVLLAHHPTPRTQWPTPDPVRIRVSIGPRRPLLLAGGPPASSPRLWDISPRLAHARSTLAPRTMAPPTDKSLTERSEAPPPMETPGGSDGRAWSDWVSLTPDAAVVVRALRPCCTVAGRRNAANQRVQPVVDAAVPKAPSRHGRRSSKGAIAADGGGSRSPVP